MNTVSKLKTREIVKKICEQVTGSLSLELVDVEYVKEGGSWYLRVYIDKPDGINHEDCQAVSYKLGELLDTEDHIPHSYILEVSSPGIERPLKKPEDYVRFRGRKVRAVTFQPVDGQKEFIGELAGLEDDKVIIIVSGKQVVLPQEYVAKVRLEADF